MTLKKKIKIAIAGTLGLAVLLFVVLIVHIAIMVKGRTPPENATIQMARADFDQQPDVAGAGVIESRIRAMNGVKDTYYNPASKILIYTFDATKNNAVTIFNRAVKPSGFKVALHTFSKEEMSRGCPAMDNSSFYSKLTAMIARMVN